MSGMKRGGGSDADQRKTYWKPPDPPALRQAEKGPPTLSATQLRDRGAQMLARKLPHDALALLTQGNDERDGQAVARLVTGRTACQAINAGGDTQHTSYATRAQTHAFMEQWEQSLDDARKAVTVKRDYVKGYVLMGDALMRMQRCAEALYVYQRGLKAAVTQAQAAAGSELADGFGDAEARGDAAVATGSTEEAVKWYSQAMGVFADERADEAVAAVCMKRAACWRELNDARGVVADCDEAAALGAAGATLFATRAVAYEQLGRFAEALADVNRVAALTPSDKATAEAARRLEKLVQHEKEERKAARHAGDAAKAEHLDAVKATEAARVEAVKAKLHKCSHMDPDGLQYFTRHYGYW